VSFGGYESLAIPVDPTAFRSVRPWNATTPLVRLHVGLEDPADLIADLEAGFAQLTAVVAGERA
jgi:cystathionine beta-lyase